MNRIVGTNLEAIYEEVRAGDVKDSQADISKAKALLGYAPTVDLEEGLRRTLAWCRAESAAPPDASYGRTASASRRRDPRRRTSAPPSRIGM